MLKTIGAAALLAIGAPSLAATYDPFAQLSSSTPTVGNFVYGTYNSSTGAITPFALYQNPCDGNANTTCARNAGSLPVVYANTGAAYQTGTAFVPNDRLGLHPDPSTYAGVAFIAPTAGVYTFAGQFSIQDVSPTGVDTGARTLADPNVLPNFLLNGAGGTRDFNFSYTLASGEGLGFYVGPAGNYTFDSTGLKLLVSSSGVAALPEPATWAMMIGGFGMVGGSMRFRRRKTQVTFATA